MQQPYVIISHLLYGMTTTNWAWYTHEDHVFPLSFKLTEEQTEKDKERTKNVGKMMTLLDILAKNVMAIGDRSINVVSVGYLNPNEAKLEAL